LGTPGILSMSYVCPQQPSEIKVFLLIGNVLRKISDKKSGHQFFKIRQDCDYLSECLVLLASEIRYLARDLSEKSLHGLANLRAKSDAVRVQERIAPSRVFLARQPRQLRNRCLI
jgi:hypothetical protein